ncbi:MAG: hypothetical protein HY247_02260 [archaeon]|nr:MAG: hypothetical protein HY247_02260 [archaeon]
MDDITVGVFCADSEAKGRFLAGVAKKSEAEGLSVFVRSEAGRKISFLDSSDFPEKLQGYASIASIVDYALYLYPRDKLTPPDGELAVLLGAFGLPGSLVVLDHSSDPEVAKSSLRGTAVGSYPILEHDSASGAIDLSSVGARETSSRGTLVFIDRAFAVKGVGTVALGFVLSGKVKVHDQLRPIPGPEGAKLDVRSIQVSDQDFDSAGRGVRVGLSLKGMEPKELERAHWLDDSSTPLSSSPSFFFEPAPFYRQQVEGRELHVQLPGKMISARVAAADQGIMAELPFRAPAWPGMRASVIDLNGKALRVAGRATCKF